MGIYNGTWLEIQGEKEQPRVVVFRNKERLLPYLSTGPFFRLSVPSPQNRNKATPLDPPTIDPNSEPPTLKVRAFIGIISRSWGRDPCSAPKLMQPAIEVDNRRDPARRN